MAMKIKDSKKSRGFFVSLENLQFQRDFQGLNKFKQLKKGIYFTIDSIIAGGIILVVIMLASSFYVKEQSNIQINYLSQDLTRILSTLTVKEINNEYINSLIDDGTIKNKENSILKQIAEFWAENKLELAQKSFSNVTEPWMPNNIGFGLWVNNESVYTRNISIKKSLVSSKKIISGIKKGQVGTTTRQNPPTLFDPVIVEVRVWE